MSDSVSKQLPSGAELPQDFEGALAALEQVVARMESGNLTLEESLVAYEQGAHLAKICQQRLDQAEQQVYVLQEQLMQPFTPENNE